MADIWNKYADTAARKHGKPGREVRPKSITIDLHAHVAVPRGRRIRQAASRSSDHPAGAFSTPETKALNAKQDADIRARMTGYDERFAVMDEMGVDMQLVCRRRRSAITPSPLDIRACRPRA